MYAYAAPDANHLLHTAYSPMTSARQAEISSSSFKLMKVDAGYTLIANMNLKET